MDPYDDEFRREVLAACDTDELRCDIAKRFKVSQSWLRRIQQQRRDTGQVTAKRAAPRQPKWHAWSEWLVAKIAAQPDIYLRELQVELKRERGEVACLGTICAACQSLDQSRKKRR
jgi:transposase